MVISKKIFYVAPLFVAIFGSNFQLQTFCQIFFGGVWLWIPIWIAVWSFDADDAKIGFGVRPNTQPEVADGALGFKLGPYGAGWYGGNNRYD